VFRQSFAIPSVKSDMAMIGIQAPEALWARQLASQRTAFAITGDGPIQSDLFPVLEYAAPRAFYIGINSTVLDNYDERTRQMQLAPANKLAVLKSLPRPEVLSILLPFSTVNQELEDSLTGNGQGANVPCAFSTTGLSPAANDPLGQAVTLLNSGDLQQAARLASLAAQQNQTNALAAYLSRVIDREQQLQGLNGKP
jgi:hypothetical protein